MHSKKIVSFALIAALGLLISLFCQTEAKALGMKKEYYPNGKVKVAAKYKNDKLDGIYKTFYENGKLQSVSYYQNGVQNGPYLEYYPSKKLKKSSAYYFDGKLQGEAVYYDENQNIERTVFYENGKKNGYTHYYKDEKIIKSEPYTDDILDGKYFLFDKYERLITLKEFDNGKYLYKEEYVYDINNDSRYPFGITHYNSLNQLDGTSYTYYPNSNKVFSETIYKNNKKQGESNIYNEDGKKAHTEIFVNDKLQSSILYEYFVTGELKSINRFNAKGETHGKQEFFHTNGKHELTIIYNNGKIADCKAVLYNENGKTTRIEQYKNGKVVQSTDYEYHPNGNVASKRYLMVNQYVTKKDYYSNGHLKIDGYINYKTKQGKVVLYYPSGIKEGEYNMLNDKENGICTNYWENGEIAYQDKYSNGKKLQRKAYNRHGKLLWTQNY